MARMEEKRRRRGANWSKERQGRRSLWRVAVGVGRTSGDRILSGGAAAAGTANQVACSWFLMLNCAKKA
jgi:hypothetical protein